MNSAFIFFMSVFTDNSFNEIQMPKTNKNKQTRQQTTISRPKKPKNLTPQTKTRMHFEEIKVTLNFIRPIFGILTENTGTLLVFKSVFWNIFLVLHFILFWFLFWSRHLILLMCLRYLLYPPSLFFSKQFWFLLPSYIFIDFCVPFFIIFFSLWLILCSHDIGL